MNTCMRNALGTAFALVIGVAALAPVSAQQERLRVVAATGTMSDVQKALRAGVNVNERNSNGVTALMTAASTNRNPAVVTLLIRHGATVDAHDRNGQTALMLAAESNDQPAVVLALLAAGAQLEDRDALGRTALISAALSNASVDVVKALLKAGARVDVRDELDMSARDYAELNAALARDAEVMRLLEGSTSVASSGTESARN